MRLRHLLSAFAIGASLFAGVAIAQNINKSMQLSQDPTGAFGVDVNNNMYLLKGQHLLASTAGGGAPPSTLQTGNGNGMSLATVTGTDFNFQIVTPAVSTSGIFLFGVAYLTAPRCVVAASGQVVPTFTTTTTGINFTTDVASSTYVGFCSSTS